MNSIEEFYTQIYNLAYIQRYSIVPRIKSESVAEHSFFVASLVIKLSEKYIFNVPEATMLAVMHDWSESFLGDITVKTKNEYLCLKEAVKISEDIVMDKFSNLNYFWQKLKGDSIEAKIVHLADVIQCQQYAEHEISLGNNGYMLDVLNSTKQRRKDIEAKIRGYRIGHII